MDFIPQCKGKDLDKLPTRSITTSYMAGVKYDGNYTQIHKKGNDVAFFTSGGHNFYFPNIAKYLIDNNQGVDFVLEAEFIADTEGKLGSRVDCSTGSYRAKFKHGNNVNAKSSFMFMVFDIILPGITFVERRVELKKLNLDCDNLDLVYFHHPATLQECVVKAKQYFDMGFEGMMAYSTEHKYVSGKRQNTSVKLKFRPTADLLCIGIVPGEGKYVGQIGALLLRDEDGLEVNVGSGLTDFERGQKLEYFIGKTIEIEYEQILATYIEPTYKCVREDK